MQFGDRNVFGMQVELDANYGGSWLFGRFCYWINGAQVGDYNLGTSLRDLFFSMKWIAYDRGKRRGHDLCNLPPHEMFLLLDNSLYGDKETVAGSSIPETPARFDIAPRVDIFDGWKVYLVDCEMYDLILYSKTGADNKIEVFNAPAGIFDIVITQTYDYLENLVDSQAK